MDTMLASSPTRWLCETNAQGAYDSKVHDVRHEAILFNHGRYTDVEVNGAGQIVFVLANGARLALRRTDLVHISLLHTPR